MSLCLLERATTDVSRTHDSYAPYSLCSSFCAEAAIPSDGVSEAALRNVDNRSVYVVGAGRSDRSLRVTCGRGKRTQTFFLPTIKTCLFIFHSRKCVMVLRSLGFDQNFKSITCNLKCSLEFLALTHVGTISFPTVN